MTGKSWQETKNTLFSINGMANLPAGITVVNKGGEGAETARLTSRMGGGKGIWGCDENCIPFICGV